MKRSRWCGLIVAVAVALATAHAGLCLNMCAMTGNVSTIYGSAGANVRVYYRGVETAQNPSTGAGTIVPGSNSCSVLTDSAGNLPTTGNCTSFIQGVRMYVTVGGGAPVLVQVPYATSTDLSTLILANTDPPSLVTSVQVAAGGDFTMTATNPGTGSIGTTTLTPGQVTAVHGGPISGSTLTLTGNATVGGNLSVTGNLSAGPSTISITGSGTSTTNSTNSLSKVCVDNVCPVTAFGAKSSITTGTIKVTGGSTAAVLVSAGDFAVGDGVWIGQVGTSTSLSTPASLTIQTIKREWPESVTCPPGGGVITLAHAANFVKLYEVDYGAYPTLATAMPEAPLTAVGSAPATGQYVNNGNGTITCAAGDQNQPFQVIYDWNDTSGATSHTYACSQFDSSTQPSLTASVSSTTTTSAATLDRQHLNRLTCGSVNKPTVWWRDGTFIGSTDSNTWDDFTLTVEQTRPPWWPSSPPTSPYPAPFFTKLDAINGSNVTLHDVPPNGDGTTAYATGHDNTAAFAAAVTAAAAVSTSSNNAGAAVLVPPGYWYGNWTLQKGVAIRCANTTYASQSTDNNSFLASIRPGQPLVTIPSGAYASGVERCGMNGLGAGGLGDVGISQASFVGARSFIQRNGMFQFGDGGIVETGANSSTANRISDNFISACIARTRSAPCGAITLTHFDDVLARNEATTSSLDVSSPNLYNAALLISGGGTAWFSQNDWEISDVGWYVNASFNQAFVNQDRFDLNFGHGLYVATGGLFTAVLSGIRAHRNGRAISGQFDNVHINGANGAALSISLSRTNSVSGDSWRIRHLIWDSGTGAAPTFWSSYVNVLGGANAANLGPTEAPILCNNGGNGSAYSCYADTPQGPPAIMSQELVSFAGATQLDVSMLTTIKPTNVSPTTITAFCNGPPNGSGVCQMNLVGQTIRVIGDANTTIQNGTDAGGNTIITKSGANILTGTNAVYEFLATGPHTWTEVGKVILEGDLQTSGLLGNLTSTPGATLLQQCAKMQNAGHLTTLKCTTDLNGTCTTAPTFGTRDTTTATNGTGTVACGNTAGVVTQSTPGLSFNAGDEVCITRTVNGSSCTASQFGVDAHWTEP